MPESSPGFIYWLKGQHHPSKTANIYHHPISLRGNDIVVETYNSRVSKKYVHTVVMGARIEPPPLEEIKADELD